MKTIQNVNLWVDGQSKSADRLKVILTNDNLENSATFTYMIGVESGNPIIEMITYANGVVVIDGQDYEDWDNSNDQAYTIVADKLNITIL